MKRLAIILFFCIPFLSPAQNFEKSWKGYFSYVSIKDITQGDNKIYVASENAIFTYDIATREITTISTINGLSGEAISTIYYSEEYKLLVIGYETGLIEIVKKGEENVSEVVDILEKQTIPPNQKRINHFNENDGNLYISTQYGISVYNLARLEFGDTYFIGDNAAQINIYQTSVKGPYIYAVTSEGIKRAQVADDNLIDYESWPTQVSGIYKGIQLLSDQLYVLSNNNAILQYDGTSNLNQVGNFNSPVLDFVSDNGLLTITTKDVIKTYSDGFVLEATANNIQDFETVFQSGYALENNLYLGTTDNGLLIVPFNSNQALQVLPDGPILNNPFSIDATPGQLWVSFGEVDIDYNPYYPDGLSKRGISNLKDTLWTNISYQELRDATGAEPSDLVKVTINPSDPNEVFMSSFQKGLLKIVEQVPTILYDETNSPLDRITVPGGGDAGIRIFGSEFDPQGNLWFVQSRTKEGLIKLTPSGQFQKIDISSIVNETEPALTELAISREGYIFFGSYGSGVFGYSPRDNKFNVISENPGAGNLPTNNIRALAFDKQNRLWIGTQKGLRVLFSPGSFFEENASPESQPIIILDGDVPQELLFEQPITDIQVDGSNNKWIATTTSGVFYLSPNGDKTLLRFTKDNSPLPSNNVQEIAIDPFTGVVYFATTKGLVAYKGTATAPGENLDNLHAFPNPVRPGFAGNVTIDGLTAQANVKITDITGNLVFEATSEGGSVLWDTTAFGKYKVRSGVYLVLVTTDDYLETKVSKIMIIR